MSKRRSDAARAVPIFAALADETRLRLVERLGEGRGLSIGELTSGTTMSRQAVTKHLTVLREAGLTRGTRRGREHVWELTPEKLRDARRFLELVEGRWDESLERLRKLVEG